MYCHSQRFRASEESDATTLPRKRLSSTAPDMLTGNPARHACMNPMSWLTAATQHSIILNLIQNLAFNPVISSTCEKSAFLSAVLHVRHSFSKARKYNFERAQGSPDSIEKLDSRYKHSGMTNSRGPQCVRRLQKQQNQ